MYYLEYFLKVVDGPPGCDNVLRFYWNDHMFNHVQYLQNSRASNYITSPIGSVQWVYNQIYLQCSNQICVKLCGVCTM